MGKGYTVRNNRFVDHSGKAIYVIRSSEVLIEGNEMVQQIAPQREYIGIDATFHTDAKVIGNDFDLTQPEAYKLSSLHGISVREVQGEGLSRCQQCDPHPRVALLIAVPLRRATLRD